MRPIARILSLVKQWASVIIRSSHSFLLFSHCIYIITLSKLIYTLHSFSFSFSISFCQLFPHLETFLTLWAPLAYRSIGRTDGRTVGRSVWSLLLVCLRSVSSVSHYAAVRPRRTVLQPCCVSASELWPFRLLQCTLDWICLRKFLRRD